MAGFVGIRIVIVASHASAIAGDADGSLGPQQLARHRRWPKALRRPRHRPGPIQGGNELTLHWRYAALDDAEIYFLRPKADDADRLLRLAEAIVYQHAMTLPALRTSVSRRSRRRGRIRTSSLPRKPRMRKGRPPCPPCPPSPHEGGHGGRGGRMFRGQALRLEIVM